MHVVHLMASPFMGGPERQMLGLAQHLPTGTRSTFLSFAERGKSQAFIDAAREAGFEARALKHNFPKFGKAIAEISEELRQLGASVLTCSGYKPDILGWRAARKAGIPVVSISHGWTGATWKVRLNETVDRWILRWFDAVVAVSNAQADKIRATGCPLEKIVTIRNSIGNDAFLTPTTDFREQLLSMFGEHRPRWIIGAAGRLSPEKNFALLVEAAARVMQDEPEAGFVLFGEGPLRESLVQLIQERGIGDRFVLAGFKRDLPQFLPNLDVGVMSSTTEGLPVILLEMSASAVPMVCTCVGGIPEVLEEGQTGHLVPSGDAILLSRRILDLLRDDTRRIELGRRASERVRSDFSFREMGLRYQELFERLVQR